MLAPLIPGSKINLAQVLFHRPKCSILILSSLNFAKYDQQNSTWPEANDPIESKDRVERGGKGLAGIGAHVEEYSAAHLRISFIYSSVVKAPVKLGSLPPISSIVGNAFFSI